MLILGLETSCDETAAAVVESGRWIRSSIVASQTSLHAPYAGVVPELASRAHAERLLPIVREALSQAGVGFADLGAIAVGHRPGLIGPLLVGVSAAKALSWSLRLPLVGVDHVHAHLYAGLLEPAVAGVDASHAISYNYNNNNLCAHQSHPSDLPVSMRDLTAFFPALGLVVSGGHTALFRCDSATDLTRLGGTIDDALGEAYDKAATILGLPYPGGPQIDRLAQEPTADARAWDFPVSRLAPGSLDFSFSGLKTSLLYAVRGRPGAGHVGPARFERDHTSLDEKTRVDLAASFQRAAVEAVVGKIRRAFDAAEGDAAQVDAAEGKAADDASAGVCGRACRYRTLIAGGGVTANSALRRALQELAGKRGLVLRLPPMNLCVDNAAMIAGLGHALLAAGRSSDLTLAACPTTAL